MVVVKTVVVFVLRTTIIITITLVLIIKTKLQTRVVRLLKLLLKVLTVTFKRM